MKTQISLVLALALALTAEVANADFTFGEPTNMGPTLNTTSTEQGPSISADGLTLFFSSMGAGGYGSADIWVATRVTKDEPWDTPVNLGPIVNSGALDTEADISSDGLELYFESERSGGFGGADIWMTRRETKNEPWGAPVNLGPLINTGAGDGEPCISADGLELYFVSDRHGADDLWVATRATPSDDWSSTASLGPIVNIEGVLWSPEISADGRLLFFCRKDTLPVSSDNNGDIWLATRDTVADDWNPPVGLGTTINSGPGILTASLSADGQFLLFDADCRPGGLGHWDIWRAPILSVVDFTGDYQVDIEDLLIFTELWGQNEPSPESFGGEG